MISMLATLEHLMKQVVEIGELKETDCLLINFNEYSCISLPLVSYSFALFVTFI